MKLRVLLASLVLSAATVAVLAAGSASYNLNPTELDNGGGPAVSPSYTLAAASIGGNVFAGTAGSASYVHQTSYVSVLQTGNASAAPAVVLAAGPANPSASNEGAGATGIPVLQARLTAGQSSGVTVNGFTIRASGSGDDTTGVLAAYLYLDADGDGQVDSGSTPLATLNNPFTADDGTAAFTLNYTIAAGGSAVFLVVYDFAAAASGDFAASVSPSGIAAVKQGGADPAPASGPTVTGGIKTVGGAGPGTLTLSRGPANLADGNRFSPGQEGPILQFRLAASSQEEVDVSGVWFTASGTLDDVSDVEGIRLFLDDDADGRAAATDVPVATASYPFHADNGRTVLHFPAVRASASNPRLLLAVVKFSSASLGAQTFGLSIARSSDLETTGVTSAASVAVQGAPVGSIVSLAPGIPVLPAPPREEEGSCGAAGPGSSPLAAFLLLLAAAAAWRLRSSTPLQGR